ncbi:MAG: hypothetical protein KKF48_03220 [Nanoarchaeota archaeon]|nr:hypothetical protein [Nanoarchaeota archaeon]MBU1028034.1 hypothetical protein [Nanoarchaeota archaeon]
MKKKISKTKAEQQIKEFFNHLKNKKTKEIKKIKRLAMSYNIKLGKKRKLFCKKCFTPYQNPKIKIKSKIKSVECENCGYKSRWKMK